MAPRLAISLASKRTILALIWASFTLAASYSLAVISLNLSCADRVADSRAMRARVWEMLCAPTDTGVRVVTRSADPMRRHAIRLVPRRTRVITQAYPGVPRQSRCLTSVYIDVPLRHTMLRGVAQLAEARRLNRLQ